MTMITPSPDEDLFAAAMERIHAMDPANNETIQPEEPNDTEEAPEPTSEPEVSEEPPEPVSVTEPEYIELEQAKITRADAQRYYEFEQFLKANPIVAERINEALRQQPIVTEPTPPPEPEPLPDFIDPTDPATAYLLAELTKVRDQQSTFIKDFNDRKQREDIATYERARDQWNASRFSPEELTSIETEASNLRIMPGLIIGGMSIEQATNRTLDTALRSIPEIYDRYISARSAEQRTRDNADKQRQSKLSTLAGRTGVTSVPVPATTPAEKRQAMVNDISSAMNE